MSFLEELRTVTESVLHASEHVARKRTAESYCALVELASPHMGYIKNRMRKAAKLGAWHIIIAADDIIAADGTSPETILWGVYYTLMAENMFVEYREGRAGAPSRLHVSWKK